MRRRKDNIIRVKHNRSGALRARFMKWVMKPKGSNMILQVLGFLREKGFKIIRRSFNFLTGLADDSKFLQIKGIGFGLVKTLKRGNVM